MQAIVNIDVPDLDPAIGFYVNATGLQLVRRLFDGTVAELEGGGLRVMLFVLNSDAPDALPVFSELLLTLWKKKALSSDTLHGVLLDGISHSSSSLTEVAIQRLNTVMDTLVKQGALAREQADSLRLQAHKGPRTRVKNRF